MGGNFATRLAAAGNEVSMVVRGAHLEAISNEVIELNSDMANHACWRDPAIPKASEFYRLVPKRWESGSPEPLIRSGQTK